VLASESLKDLNSQKYSKYLSKVLLLEYEKHTQIKLRTAWNKCAMNQHEKTQLENVGMFDSLITDVSLNHRVCVLEKGSIELITVIKEAGKKYGNMVRGYHTG